MMTSQNAAIDEDAWMAAEAKVRAHFGTKNPVQDIRRANRPELTAFWVTTADGKAHDVIVAGGKVYVAGKPSNKVVSAVLKAERVLERQQLRADDMLYLVHTFGKSPRAPRSMHDALGQQIGGTAVVGYEPKLEYGKGRATLVVHWPKQQRHGGSSTTMTLFKAVLKINGRCGLSWKVTEIQVPRPDSAF